MDNDNKDVQKKAFTIAVFDADESTEPDEENRCHFCGKHAARMMRLTDFTLSQPLEVYFCSSCWEKYTRNGQILNPLKSLNSSSRVSPSHLLSELNLTELPLPEALERLYGACEMIKGGYIRSASELPLVGPVKLRSRSLSNALDCILGPVGLKWDIHRDVIVIAASNDEVEKIKAGELRNGQG